MFSKAATGKIKNIADINVKLILNNYLVSHRPKRTFYIYTITARYHLHNREHTNTHFTYIQQDSNHGPFDIQSNDNTTRPNSRLESGAQEFI